MSARYKENEFEDIIKATTVAKNLSAASKAKANSFLQNIVVSASHTHETAHEIDALHIYNVSG
jgi:hypothetical protein